MQRPHNLDVYALLDDDRPRGATRHIAPDLVTGDQLDALLAQGWYRISQTLIYCDCVTLQRGIRGVIWTRVPLATYTFRKSLRKLMRRIERDFEVLVHPCVLDEEHEQLYQRYLLTASGDRSPNLQDVRYGNRRVDLFDTWEVSIRHEGELIAFSWFDLGKTSLQSILAVYAPEHSANSLGFYTMLREVQYGIDHGFDYFYAGYILCNDPAMDYKLRTGHIEYLDRTTQQWVPQSHIDPVTDDPLARAAAALRRFDAQTQHWLHGTLETNKHFSLSAYAPNLSSCLFYPIFLRCKDHLNHNTHLVIGWDSAEQSYHSMRCLRGSLADAAGHTLIDDLHVIVDPLDTADTADQLVDAIRHRMLTPLDDD